MAIFFTADTHFGDPHILRHRRARYDSVAAHDAALVAAWNAVVGPDDAVWHLGDFAAGRVGSIARRYSRSSTAPSG